jgi:hypothetical protein
MANAVIGIAGAAGGVLINIAFRQPAETETLRTAILRSRRWLGGIDPRPGRRLAAAGLACG